GDAASAFTGKGLSAAQRDARDWLRALLTWRRDTPVLHHGRLQHFAPEGGSYVFFRFDEAAAVMVALNKSGEEIALPIDRFADFIRPGDRGRDPVSGEAIVLGDALALPARSATLLEFSRPSPAAQASP